MRNDDIANANQGRCERSNFKPQAKEKLSSADVIVPILQFGSGNNFYVFKEKLALTALEKFGDLARLVETDEYWKPPALNFTEYNPDEDPHGFIKLQVNELLKEHVRVIERMKNNKANLYAFILSKLTNESMDEVKRHEGFDDFNSTKDPLELWLAAKQIHRIDTKSMVQEFRKKSARDKYHRIRQGQYESLVKYKARFDVAYETYVELTNLELDDADVAMDFLYSFDPSRYGAFVSDIVNDVSVGAINRPENLNTVYAWANSRVETSQRRSDQVSFVNVNRNGRSHQGKRVKEKNAECYNCGRRGHYERNCAQDPDGEDKVSATTLECALPTVHGSFMFDSASHHSLGIADISPISCLKDALS